MPICALLSFSYLPSVVRPSILFPLESFYRLPDNPHLWSAANEAGRQAEAGVQLITSIIKLSVRPSHKLERERDRLLLPRLLAGSLSRFRGISGPSLDPVRPLAVCLTD